MATLDWYCAEEGEAVIALGWKVCAIPRSPFLALLLQHEVRYLEGCRLPVPAAVLAAVPAAVARPGADVAAALIGMRAGVWAVSLVGAFALCTEEGLRGDLLAVGLMGAAVLTRRVCFGGKRAKCAGVGLLSQGGWSVLGRWDAGRCAGVRMIGGRAYACNP